MTKSIRFQPGDRVHWTATKQGSGSLTLMRREGVIEAIRDESAKVKLPSGHRTWVHFCRLRQMDAPSQITELIETVRDASQKS